MSTNKQFSIQEVFNQLDVIKPGQKRTIKLNGEVIKVSKKSNSSFNRIYQMSKEHGLKCSCCGVQPKFVSYTKLNGLQLIISGTNSLTLDHIIPQSKGGSSTLENLTIMCRNCNVKKSDNLDENLVKFYDLDTVYHNLVFKFKNVKDELINLISRMKDFFGKKIDENTFKNKIWKHFSAVIGNYSVQNLRVTI